MDNNNSNTTELDEQSNDNDNQQIPNFYDNILNLKKADIITSIVLFFFGIYLIIESFKLPVEKLTRDPEKWYAAPGVFPGFVGFIIVFLSIYLLIQAVKQIKKEGTALSFLKKEDMRGIADFIRSNVFIRFIIAFGFLFLYVFVLVGWLPYGWATLIYMFSNMLMFKSKKLSLSLFIKYLIISSILSFGVAYAFSEFALIPLP